MKLLILIIFIMACIFITIGYNKSNLKCPPTKIEYRYIPKSLYQIQFEEQNINELFDTMFN